MSAYQRPTCSECEKYVYLYATKCYQCLELERASNPDAQRLLDREKNPYLDAFTGDTYKGVTIERNANGPPNCVYYVGHGKSVRVWPPDDAIDFMNDIDVYFLTGLYEKNKPESVSYHAKSKY